MGKVSGIVNTKQEIESYLSVRGGWSDKENNNPPLEFTFLFYFLFCFLFLFLMLIPSTLSHGGSPSDSNPVSLIDFSCSCRLEVAAAASNCAEHSGSSLPALFLSFLLCFHIPVDHNANTEPTGAQKTAECSSSNMLGHGIYSTHHEAVTHGSEKSRCSSKTAGRPYVS